MSKIEELRAAHQYFESLWLCRDAGGMYSIGSGDDIIATSTSESLARFAVYAHNNMPALLEAVEAMREVLRISDRKHEAWERAYAVLEKLS